MRADMRRSGDRPGELDSVSKLVLALLAILGLLIAAYAVIHYAADYDRAKHQLASRLPADYRETIKAIMVSAGNSCPSVCGLDPVTVAPDGAVFKVKCGVGQAGGSCDRTQAYMVTIAPAPEASR